MGPTQAVTPDSHANALIFPESRTMDTELWEPLPLTPSSYSSHICHPVSLSLITFLANPEYSLVFVNLAAWAR